MAAKLEQAMEGTMYPEVRNYDDPFDGLVTQVTELRGPSRSSHCSLRLIGSGVGMRSVLGPAIRMWR